MLSGRRQEMLTYAPRSRVFEGLSLCLAVSRENSLSSRPTCCFRFTSALLLGGGALGKENSSVGVAEAPSHKVCSRLLTPSVGAHMCTRTTHACLASPV